jgi:hypothetical protein
VDLVAEDVDGVIPPRVGIITVFQHRQL